MFGGATACRYLGAGHLKEPGHGGKQIIEMVGNAAGQLTDRLHLLRLPQLFFETFSPGDVKHRPFEHETGVSLGQGDVFEHPGRAAVLAAEEVA